MIELRWVIRMVPCQWDNEGNVHAVKDEKVLQYRVFNPVGCDEDGVHHYNGDPANWTDWQDVPTVREGG